MMIIQKVSVLYQRNRKYLVFILYGVALALSTYVIYDTLGFLQLMFPAYFAAPAQQQPETRTAGPIFVAPTLPPAPPLKKVIDFPFIPKVHKCDEMFFRSGFQFTYSEFYWEHVDAYKSALSLCGILSDGNINEQSWTFHEIAKLPYVQTVCETGFHSGHNTFHFLTAKPDVYVYSFESHNFNYTEDMSTFMTAEFPDRFEFYAGDTKKTIPTFQQENKDIKCDIIFVETHKDLESIEADIENFKIMTNKKENILILDTHGDHNKTMEDGIEMLWNRLKSTAVVSEHFRCNFEDGENSPLTRPGHAFSGFIVGSFVFN